MERTAETSSIQAAAGVSTSGERFPDARPRGGDPQPRATKPAPEAARHTEQWQWYMARGGASIS
jgi:hypothetical protein